MMPNITRGDRMNGLLSYLFGPGRENEHANSRVVAGDSDSFLWYGGRDLDAGEVAALARDLDRTRVLTGTSVSVVRRRSDRRTGVVVEDRAPAHVWHCSLSLRHDDKELTDEQWQAVASDFVDEMGFTSLSGKAECKWVAVNHGLSKKGNAHVHIAVSMVREDGTKASTHNDFSRAQRICIGLEQKYGLAITSDRAAGLGTRGWSPAARAAAERRGAIEPDARRLERAVRAAAATSADEAEFVRRCRRNGLLIRPRFAKGRNDIVEGYSVALRAEKGGVVIWHGGKKLAKDLTITRLRAEWPDSVDAAQSAVDEWRAAYRGERIVSPGREVTEYDPELWRQKTESVRQMREQLRAVPLDDKATWAIVAKETSGIFAAWSQRIEAVPGPLAAVSTELARSAQIRAHQVRPRPTKLVRIGGVAMLAAANMSKGGNAAQTLLMVRQLANTAEAIHDVIHARGDATRAAEMATLVRTKLGGVANELKREADKFATTGKNVALRELGRFSDGNLRANDQLQDGPVGPRPGKIEPSPHHGSDLGR